jgi:SAM-dependent methyltransferase
MREQSIFLCPNCGLPLEACPRSYGCPRGHTFDRARSGYVNLRQGARRGDTRAMLLARRAFLERGFFEPISSAINDRVVEHLERLRAANRLRGDEAVVDAGCGEGYYLARLAERLQGTSAFAGVHFVGLDASREAARLTAGRLPGRLCAVVDIAHGLHVRHGSAAVLLDVFAPRNPRAFAETLMRGGLCLVVTPRAEHMKELRSLLPLLQIPREKRDRVVRQFEPHLALTRCDDLDYLVRLDAEAVRAWLQMGPNAWHLTAEQLSDVWFPGTVETRVACTLMSFAKACFTRDSV